MCPLARWMDNLIHSDADLTEPVDIYSEWIDAADAAQKDTQVHRRPAASSSRLAPAAPSSDDEG